MFWILVGAFTCCSRLAVSSTVLFSESFETDGNGVRYVTSTPEFSDGIGDYFGRTNGSGISSSVEFTNIPDGTYFFAAQDIDGDGASSDQTIDFSSIDISGYTGLEFSGYFAEDDVGAEDWDLGDLLYVDYSIDGGQYTKILQFAYDRAGGDNSNEIPRQDTDFDGIGDGTELTPAFTQFIVSIPETGSSLDLKIFVELDAADEDIAFDLLQVTGEAIMVSSLQPFSTTEEDSETFESTIKTSLETTIQTTIETTIETTTDRDATMDELSTTQMQAPADTGATDEPNMAASSTGASADDSVPDESMETTDENTDDEADIDMPTTTETADTSENVDNEASAYPSTTEVDGEAQADGVEATVISMHALFVSAALMLCVVFV